jgi:hypothetical protein
MVLKYFESHSPGGNQLWKCLRLRDLWLQAKREHRKRVEDFHLKAKALTVLFVPDFAGKQFHFKKFWQ